jgi:hypothetical protein
VEIPIYIYIYIYKEKEEEEEEERNWKSYHQMKPRTQSTHWYRRSWHTN